MKIKVTSPNRKRFFQRALDLLVLSLALWMAFLLRFEGALPPQIFKRLLFVWPYIVWTPVCFLADLWRASLCLALRGYV